MADAPSASPGPASAETPPIPDYAMLRRIGRGSYGDVWLARGVTGVYCAIKIVWRDRFPEPQPYEREFKGLREFAAVSLLESRQLALLHVSRNDALGFFYYVMELADDVTAGRQIDPANYTPHTLAVVRQQRGRIPTPELVALGADLARAVSGLHSRGLVHRDIKPSNVIVVGGAPKLADVGLVTTAREGLTFVGTEGYVPPEGPGAPSADVFSLGKLLYELMSGLDRHDYPRLPPNLQALPDRKELLELNEVLIRACEPDPRRRYQTADALLDELLLLQAGRSVRRLRSAERHLSRALRAAAVLAVAAVIGGMGAWAEHRRAARAEAERDALRERVVYSGLLTQTREALEQEEYGRARDLLRRARAIPNEAALRGIEWNALWARARGEPATVIFTSENGGIRRMMGGGDGAHLAVLDEKNRVHVLPGQGGPATRVIENVERLAGFSDDGRALIGWAKGEHRLSWWPVMGNAVEAAGPIEETALPIATAPENQLVIFTRGPVRSVAVVHARTGEVLQRHVLESEPGRPPWDLFRGAVSRDGRRAIVYCIQGRGATGRFRTVAINLATKRIDWDGTPPGLPTGVGLLDSAPDYLMSIGVEGRVFRLRAGAREWQEVVKLGQQLNLFAERSDAPGVLLCLGTAPTVVEINLHSPAEPGRRWRGHGGRVPSIYLAETGGRFWTAGNDGTVRLWSTKPNPLQTPIASWEADGNATSLVASPNGDRLLAPLNGKSVSVIATDTWQTVATWPDMRLPLAWFGSEVWTLSPDGEGIESWNVGGTIPQRLRRLEANPRTALIGTTFSADGQRVAAGTADGKFYVWSTNHGESVAEIKPHVGAVWGSAFTAGGKRLWSVGNDRSLVATDLVTGRELRRITLPTPAPLSISPDGDSIALVYLDGRLELRSAADGSVRQTGIVNPGLVRFARFTSDGKRLLVGGPAGTLQVVSASDATVICTLTIPTGSDLAEVALPQNESWMAVVSATGRITPWPLADP